MKGKKHKPAIPILSFYSGGGFLDMGFEMAGFEIVWTNENDESFAKLHSSGITSWRKSRGNGVKAEIFNTKSITNIKSKQIVSEAFPTGLPKHFGIIGGPPCQDFSTNGSSIGFVGERGKLTIEFIKKIHDLKPTFFVMENVTGLLKHKSHKEYLFELLKKIKKLYYLDYKILNALEFGVPQFRERVFFVGIRKDLSKKIRIKEMPNENWFPWPSRKSYIGALNKYSWPSPNSFGNRITKPKTIPFELCVQSCLVAERSQNKVANADEYFVLYGKQSSLKKIKEGETNRPSFKRLHRFKFSPTACYGNNEVHLHPFEQRRISVREALRIQGVPDEYVLPKEIFLTKKFKMIGNGVPVPLANAVAASLKIFLKKKYKIKI